MSRKLDNALSLYMEGIRDGKVRQAVTQYTGERYTQHSTGVADGVEGFVAFFEPFMERVKKRDIQVVRTVEDGRFVFCHVTQDLNDGEARWITTDLFDTDEEGKIIEHWDVIAPWQEASEVEGSSTPVDSEPTEANKELIEEFVTRVLIGRASEEASSFLKSDLIQHELGIANGAQAWIESLEAREVRYNEIFRLIGQKNFVVTYCKVDIAKEPFAVFDIYRLEEGRIVERWNNAEVVPEDTGNSGKF